MLLMFTCKEGGLVVVATLPAHGNGRVEVELQITRRANEFFELLDILELGVAVEQKRCVIWSGTIMLVELF
jgi:hypothetical protein